MNTTVSVTNNNESVTFAIDYAGQNAFSLIDQERMEYRSCMNCARHPRFPEIPAVTLHKGGRCTLCKSQKNVLN